MIPKSILSLIVIPLAAACGGSGVEAGAGGGTASDARAASGSDSGASTTSTSTAATGTGGGGVLPGPTGDWNGMWMTGIYSFPDQDKLPFSDLPWRDFTHVSAWIGQEFVLKP